MECGSDKVWISKEKGGGRHCIIALDCNCDILYKVKGKIHNC